MAERPPEAVAGAAVSVLKRGGVLVAIIAEISPKEDDLPRQDCQLDYLLSRSPHME